MDNKLARSQDASGKRKAIQQVLVNQYVLHEIRHHSRTPGPETGSLFVAPKAHTLADIYKCLHQGEFGVGHSIQDPVRFGERLLQDLLVAEPSAAEPILEDVSCDGSVFRLNLRPYRHRFVGHENKASALLLQVCLESAGIQRGNSESMLAVLAEFRDLNDDGELGVEGTIYSFPTPLADLFLSEVKDFIEQWGGIPVLSHSVTYRKH
ncbi:MAG: hypothetical protein FJY85_09790, partial [Deltaproteobacteria bacterium]|nr:hypothetical protein [Deltaproteobacteria bacterium]